MHVDIGWCEHLLHIWSLRTLVLKRQDWFWKGSQWSLDKTCKLITFVETFRVSG